MSLKNSSTVCDYLEFDSTLNKANKILKSEKKYKIAFLVILGINVGLRISDLRKAFDSGVNERTANAFKDKIKTKTKENKNLKFIKSLDIILFFMFIKFCFY